MIVYRSIVHVLAYFVILGTAKFLPKECTEKYTYLGTQTIRVYVARPVNRRCRRSGFLGLGRCQKYGLELEYLRVFAAQSAYRLACCKGTTVVNTTTCFKEEITVSSPSSTSMKYEKLTSEGDTLFPTNTMSEDYQSIKMKNISHLSNSSTRLYKTLSSKPQQAMFIFIALCSVSTMLSVASTGFIAWMNRHSTRSATCVISNVSQETRVPENSERTSH